jgi:hypothetical protein
MLIVLRLYMSFICFSFRLEDVLQEYKTARNVDVTDLCLLIVSVLYVSVLPEFSKNVLNIRILIGYNLPKVFSWQTDHITAI